MSSFIAHSIPAIALYFSPQNSPSEMKPSKQTRAWLCWLIVVAWAPDIDHLVPALNASAHQGLRITHSVVACLILPILTLLVLRSRQIGGRNLRMLSTQLGLAALSHLVFDLLTGAMALPLLYPFSPHLFKLPFGLLPSAGKISLTNYYFYRNLVIELGVLLPLFVSGHLWARQGAIAQPAIARQKTILIIGLLTCSLGFMVWAASLSR